MGFAWCALILHGQYPIPHEQQLISTENIGNICVERKSWFPAKVLRLLVSYFVIFFEHCLHIIFRKFGKNNVQPNNPFRGQRWWVRGSTRNSCDRAHINHAPCTFAANCWGCPVVWCSNAWHPHRNTPCTFAACWGCPAVWHWLLPPLQGVSPLFSLSASCVSHLGSIKVFQGLASNLAVHWRVPGWNDELHHWKIPQRAEKPANCRVVRRANCLGNSSVRLLVLLRAHDSRQLARRLWRTCPRQ